MTNTKAELIYYAKDEIQDHYILEMAMHWVGESKKYPSGIKYGLIFVDPNNGKRVLMDNHHPKGPHTHLDDKEISYQFTDIDKLVSDFKQYILTYMGVTL